ncbi:hypothetical protein [Spiroplasma endosymbiont of Nebria brevicollis]|uniref:hypothetical protein n=1 Tax=Spiroplasma endosymbiont of Nebria brevicollis TaxID=3066284 RepID=UPI00313B625F
MLQNNNCISENELIYLMQWEYDENMSIEENSSAFLDNFQNKVKDSIFFKKRKYNQIKYLLTILDFLDSFEKNKIKIINYYFLN